MDWFLVLVFALLAIFLIFTLWIATRPNKLDLTPEEYNRMLNESEVRLNMMRQNRAMDEAMYHIRRMSNQADYEFSRRLGGLDKNK